VSVEFDPAGWVYACCTSHLYPIGRIGEQRLGDIWNGARTGVLKEALQRWDMTVACQPCRFHLEHRRMDPVAAVYDQYPLADATPDLPHMMLFALSNRCNLGCVMCTPELSSKLRREAGMAPLDNPYDDRFFEDLEPFLAGLGVAKFLGGEPFLAPEHHRVWEMMDRLERPPKLSITTNGTVWTDKVEWLMDRFEVDISVSIDAASPETYAAVRRGGDLGVLRTNLDRFADRCRSAGTNLHVSYCLMPQNAHELAEFLVWAEPYTFGAPVGINLVSNEGMAIHDLPTSDLRSIRELWARDDAAVSSRLDRNLDVWRTQLDQLDAVLAERDAGHVPAATRAHRVSTIDLGPKSDGPATRWSFRDRRRQREAVDGHRRRLERWSGSTDVATVTATDAGVITAVDAPHHRLGLHPGALVGRPATALLEVMEAVDGRSGWVIEESEVDDPELGWHAVRTIILAAESPVRGVPGAVVRLIEVHGPRSRTFLVAEDRFYDRGGRFADGAVAPTATPVVLGPRRSAPHAG